MQSRNGSDAVAKVKGTVSYMILKDPCQQVSVEHPPLQLWGVKLPSAMDTQSSQHPATDSETSRLLCF